MKKIALLMILILCVTGCLPLAVQGQSDVAEQRRAEISHPVHFDKTTKPLREMFDTGEPAKPARGGRDFEPGKPGRVENTHKTFEDPLAARGAGAIGTLTDIKASTVGTPIDPSLRVAPPDTTGDIGPNHYVQWVNLRYSIYTLTRDAQNQITGFNIVPGFPKQGNVVWQGFGGRCQSDNDGDPIVQYDQLADRWVLTQFAVSGQPFTQCVAVSTSPDPTGTYFRYAFSYAKDFNDFPKMGVWPDAYYITYNMFRNGRSFVGNRVCAFERAVDARRWSGAPGVREHQHFSPQSPTCGSRRNYAALRHAESVDEYDNDNDQLLAIHGELGRRHRYADWSNRCTWRGRIQPSVWRRRMHSATRYGAKTRFACRPAELPLELSKLRHARSPRCESRRHERHRCGNSLV